MSYVDDEPVVQSRKRRRPVSRPTGQEEQKLPPAGADITPERPRKVLRRSANVTSTVSKTTGAPEKDSSSSKVKVEESISVPKVKEETTEVKVDELNELDVCASSAQISLLPLMYGKGYRKDDISAQKEESKYSAEKGRLLNLNP